MVGGAALSDRQGSTQSIDKVRLTVVAYNNDHNDPGISRVMKVLCMIIFESLHI